MVVCKDLQALGLAEATILGPDASSVQISSLAVDSRQVKPGALFFALKGQGYHGADFAPAAIEAGAVAIVASMEGAMRLQSHLQKPGSHTTHWPVPVIVLHSPRFALGSVAARFFAQQPSELVAVTGTNGKTSVAAFTAQLWAQLGRASASFGTTGISTHNLPEGDWQVSLAQTTPEPITLHHLLAELVQKGVQAAAMEASSHALVQHRLQGVRLTAAALTNLSRDHLDYHKDLQDYAAAKLRLFSETLPKGGAAVVNADDALAAVVRDIAQARQQVLMEVGFAAQGEHALRLLAQEPEPTGQKISLRYHGHDYIVHLPLVGLFQGYNALCAAALVLAGGAEPQAVFTALESLTGAAGRMECVAHLASGAAVFVDYAHTPDAIATVLHAIRPHTQGRVGLVIGAGGDRDPGKRALMGAAAQAADFVIVTDDNPRSEDPAAIRAQVLAGFTETQGHTSLQEIGDRAEAILTGIQALTAGDVLIIAGKGHETGQVIAGETLPFDDRQQVRAAVTFIEENR